MIMLVRVYLVTIAESTHSSSLNLELDTAHITVQYQYGSQ